MRNVVVNCVPSFQGSIGVQSSSWCTSTGSAARGSGASPEGVPSASTPAFLSPFLMSTSMRELQGIASRKEENAPAQLAHSSGFSNKGTLASSASLGS